MGDSTGRSARRGAPLKVLEDRTPLNGDRVDVGARIAWLLRTSRLTSPVTRGLAQYRMVTRLAQVGLDVSRSWVHRLEAGELRSGIGAEAYEQALGLAPGRLRAAIDLACRSSLDAPADSDPGELLHDVEELSAATDAVLAEDATGWDWFTWARQFSRPDVRGLRVQVARSLIRRLCVELSRAVGPAYDSRYEALAATRSGPYGRIVLETIREIAGDAHVQLLTDLVSAAAEVADAEALELCIELICDERALVSEAGAHGVESLLAGNASDDSADDLDWARLGRAVVERFDDTDADSRAGRTLAHVLRLLAGRNLPLPRPRQPLPDAPGVGAPGRRASVARWGRCLQAAQDIGAEVGLDQEPMLARLLYDLLVGWSTPVAFASSRLLGALPFAAVVAGHAVQLVEHEHDPLLRARMLSRLAMVPGGLSSEATARWLGDAELRPAGLVLLAHAGVPPPSELLQPALVDEGEAGRRLLYAAGMTQHPLLDELASAPSAAPVVRAAARWWLRHGGRVVDPD